MEKELDCLKIVGKLVLCDKIRKKIKWLVNNVKRLDFMGVLRYSGKKEWWKNVGLIVIWDILKLFLLGFV